MSVGSTNYPQPVQVNGYTCHNCTDVDNAKKHIDPAHPKSGPYGVNAATDPTNKADKKDFIQFGGTLSGKNAPGSTASAGNATPNPPPPTTAQATAPGQSVNVLA